MPYLHPNNFNLAILMLEPTVRQTQITFARLLPRLEKQYSTKITQQPDDWAVFNRRLEEHFPSLFNLYFQLYAQQYDFYFHLENLLFEAPMTATPRGLNRESSIEGLLLIAGFYGFT